MIPPTPTYIPPNSGEFAQYASSLDLSNIVNLWDVAPHGVGLWNQFRDWTPALQWILVLAALLALFWLGFILLKRFGESRKPHD